MPQTDSSNTVHGRALRNDIIRATETLECNLRDTAPHLASSVGSWMRKLSGTRHPCDYFLHPEAFPMFLLPYWAERSTHAKPARRFRRDIIYSTLNGYYSIRLMDNFIDADGDDGRLLLPAMQVFLLECFKPYTVYFPPEHCFWKTMRTTWFRSADVTLHDASLDSIDATAFANVAAQKICAVKIPLEAVCHYYDRPELIPPWSALTDTLGCWHQMLNDLFDWRKDLEHGNNTYFLSQAQRRARPRETTAEWVIREGLRWGIDALADWMTGLEAMAVDLNSPGLRRYLRKRRTLLAERLRDMAQPVHAMQQLVAAIQESR